MDLDISSVLKCKLLPKITASLCLVFLLVTLRLSILVLVNIYI